MSAMPPFPRKQPDEIEMTAEEMGRRLGIAPEFLVVLATVGPVIAYLGNDRRPRFTHGLMRKSMRVLDGGLR